MKYNLLELFYYDCCSQYPVAPNPRPAARGLSELSQCSYLRAPTFSRKNSKLVPRDERKSLRDLCDSVAYSVSKEPL